MRCDMVLTTCPYCGSGCNFYLQVMGDKIAGVIPCATHPISGGQLCVLGRNASGFVTSKDRLTKPLVRKGEKLVPVEWDEAIDRVVKSLTAIKDSSGPNALGVFSSAKCTNEENYLVMKLARGILGTNNVDHCARLCHSSTVAGLAASFGSGAMTNSVGEIEDTDCMLVTGSNTTSSHPMIASKMMTAKSRGAKLIVIDPRRIPLTEYADLFLQLLPGTNIAMFNGLIHVIIEKGLADTKFIEERTEGFDELKEKVKEYTPEYVSKITGVAPKLIEEAAVMYASASSAMIFYAMGVTQHVNGTASVKAVANLSMVTGNIGRPATGVNPLRGQNNVQGACDMGALPPVLSGYQGVANPEFREKFSKAWDLPVPEETGLTVVEMINGAKEGSIKGMLIVGENPMMTDPDINKVRGALGKLEFLVVADIFLTETAQLADVVLPASTFAEKEGTFTATDRRVQRVRQAIEPIGESKPDWQIICELGKAFGAEKQFTYKSPDDVMKEIAKVTPSYAGINFNRLDKGEVLHWPCPDIKHPGTPYLHDGKFTKGKGTFTAVDYTDPGESPDEQYPLLLTTGRVPFHFHSGSMTRRTEVLNREVPTGYVNIHPDAAKKYEVKDGETITMASRRGEINIVVKVSDEVAPEVVYIPMHFAECAANVLTDSKLDPISKIPGYKVCGVKIVKDVKHEG
jgi:formate dehydrogenase alpha subunit